MKILLINDHLKMVGGVERFIYTIKNALEKIPEIDNIHHVHAWNLNDKDIHFECHIDLKTDMRISETGNIKNIVLDILLNKFNISHVTIQYEYNCCEDKNMIHLS